VQRRKSWSDVTSLLTAFALMLLGGKREKEGLSWSQAGASREKRTRKDGGRWREGEIKMGHTTDVKKWWNIEVMWHAGWQITCSWSAYTHTCMLCSVVHTFSDRGSPGFIELRDGCRRDIAGFSESVCRSPPVGIWLMMLASSSQVYSAYMIESCQSWDA